MAFLAEFMKTTRMNLQTYEPFCFPSLQKLPGFELPVVVNNLSFHALSICPLPRPLPKDADGASVERGVKSFPHHTVVVIHPRLRRLQI